MKWKRMMLVQFSSASVEVVPMQVRTAMIVLDMCQVVRGFQQVEYPICSGLIIPDTVLGGTVATII